MEQPCHLPVLCFSRDTWSSLVICLCCVSLETHGAAVSFVYVVFLNGHMEQPCHLPVVFL